MKARVDVAVVYFHWGLHFQPAVIPMYGFEIGHAACDAGADIILGVHAHIAKGIEVYKGKVIFHGQNNFAVNYAVRGIGESPRAAPGWMYRGGALFHQMYHFEAEPGYPPLAHPEAKHTFITRVIIDKGKIQKVSYIPCCINKVGEPEIVPRSDPRGQEVFTYIEKISRSQGLDTKFTWDGDEVVINT